MSQEPLENAAATGASASEEKRSRYRFVIAALAMLLNFSFGLSFFALAPVTPLVMDQYGINRSAASLMTGLVILFQAGFALPGSMLVGRVPLKRLITIAWLVGSAPALTFLGGGFPVLLLLRGLYGLSFALMFPAVGPLLMQWFRPKELPLVNGLTTAVASLGITVSTFSVAPMSEAMGWRVAVSLYGGLTLVGAVCWLALGRTQTPDGQPERRASLSGAWRVLKSRTTLLLAIADAGPYAQYAALVAWLPTFYYEVHGMSLSRAGTLVGLLPLTGVATVVVAGLLPLRVRRRRPFLIVPGVLVGFAGIGSFLLAGTPMLPVAMVLLGFASWFYIPVLFTIPMELPGAAPERVSLTWATIMTIGGGVSFLAPLAVGATTDLLGTYLPGFFVFAALSWSLAVAGFLLPETGAPRKEAEVPLS